MRAWILAERIKASCIWHLICNIATFNRANVTMAIPSLHNCLIPERNSFRYHAVLLLMIGLLLKIIDSQKKRGKNRFIGSCSIFLIYPYTSPALQPIYIYIYIQNLHPSSLGLEIQPLELHFSQLVATGPGWILKCISFRHSNLPYFSLPS